MRGRELEAIGPRRLGPDAVFQGFRASERVVGEHGEQDIQGRCGPHMTGLK